MKLHACPLCDVMLRNGAGMLHVRVSEGGWKASSFFLSFFIAFFLTPVRFSFFPSLFSPFLFILSFFSLLFAFRSFLPYFSPFLFFIF
jgi:hypothetical protein